jgi:fluoride exporter
MYLLFLAAVGGAIGAGLRFLTNAAFSSIVSSRGAVAFPWSTLTVNVVGGFFMGVTVIALSERLGGSPEWRAFLATGLLGGFTTFSAYSLDMMNLLTEDGVSFRFVIYTAASVLLAFAALAAGMMSARWVLS